MLIPNAKNAVVEIEKLRNYCLNSDHRIGKHKAKLFRSMLGITQSDAEELRHILLSVIQTNHATLGKKDNFGQRYIIDFTLNWKNREANIRSAWIIENNSDIPRLTSCYPLK